MKRFLVLALGGLVGLSLIPAASAGGKKQSVEGSIVVPAPFFGDVNSCYSGLHRRISVLSQGQVNGLVGFDFEVDKATWGGKFKLEPTDGLGEVDLDITFYPEFGTPEQALDTAYAPPTVAYDERAPGGEAGVVPPDMNKAIVCMWAGESHQGGASTFTYTAAAPAKKKKKRLSRASTSHPEPPPRRGLCS